jgi:hypothetical protein
MVILEARRSGALIQHALQPATRVFYGGEIEGEWAMKGFADGDGEPAKRERITRRIPLVGHTQGGITICPKCQQWHSGRRGQGHSPYFKPLVRVLHRRR